MLQKYLTTSVNTHSLLTLIDVFARQRLIFQISIILSLKNTSVKSNWYRSKKCYFVSLCFFRSNFDWKFYLKELWAKKSSYETLFSNKTNICDILIFAMSQRATFSTSPYIYGIDHWRILWSSYRKWDLNPQPLNSVQTLTNWAIRSWVTIRQLAYRASFV